MRIAHLKHKAQDLLRRHLHAAGLGTYETRAPSAQNIVDLFKGQWTSALPESTRASTGGSFAAFSDPRISWAIEALSGVKGKRVLELGPLEGGHTAMLLGDGASEVVAIEANPGAFLRCLAVKEICELKNARFLHGDFMAYLEDTDERFDTCIASGVLYHLENPVALLERAARHCKELFVWTQYYDEARALRDEDFRRKIVSTAVATHSGFEHTQHRVEYLSVSSTFCGGTAGSAHWLNRRDLFGACAHFGWSDVEVAFDEVDHPNGPALAFVARRTAQRA